MQLFGRDKKYFEQNKIQNIALHFYNNAKRGITKIPVGDNYFMHMILTGLIPIPFKGHPYLDQKNYLKLKKSIEKISFINKDLLNFLESSKENINKYNLSDIFEKDTQKTYEKIISLISKKSQKGTKICYWNNLVERKDHYPNSIVRNLKKSRELFNKDRVFFYSDFIVEEKNQ